MTIDITADNQKTSEQLTGSRATELIQACLRLKNIQTQLTKLRTEQEQLTKRMLELSDNIIPALMQELHCQQLVLTGKVHVELHPIIQASIRSLSSILNIKDEDELAEAMEKRNAALQYLRREKAGSLIRQELTILLGKGNQKLASQVRQLCRQLKLPVQLEETVHPQTLCRWIRERFEQGREIDQQVLAVYVSNRAVLK